MASIETRKGARGTRYRVRVYVRGNTRTATFERRTDAKQWATRVESDLRRGRYVPTTEAMRRTVAELVDRYLADLPTKPRSRSGRNTRQQLRWWKDEIGHLTLADTTAADVIECRAKLAAGDGTTPRAPATVNRYLAALSHCFTTAVREYMWAEVNPVRHVQRMEEPQGRVRFLSDDERKRLLAACEQSESDALYPLVVLALSTGARKGELVSLTWRQVDLARSRILLEHTKNKDRRALPLVGHARDVLEARHKVRRIDSDLVFPGRRRERKPARPVDVKTAWREALKAAKVEDFKFHDLRHSAASYLAMNGATLREIAEVLGHRQLEMVKRYAHLAEQHTADVVGRMNDSIFP